MEKLKFIGLVIGGLLFYYLVASILMPIIVSTSGDAATAIESGAHADAYVVPVAGLRYAPLFLYIIPAVLAIVLIVFKLKQKER